MKVTKLNGIELTKGQMTSLRKEGWCEDNEGNEFYRAPELARFKSKDGNSEVAVRQIVFGMNTIGNKMITGAEGFDGGAVYKVEVILMSVIVEQNCKIFTELEEAIDYYNKVKAFVKEM